MAPQPPAIATYTAYGAYGVDLFFVLSGWLIGGLLWKERDTCGDVSLRRFWLRRALRTMPPYFVVLAIAWAGVAVIRGEPFDAAYLIFIQNYYEKLPFFQVSWSLCVEEHFYLVAPLLAVLGGSRALAVILACLLVLSPLVRLYEYRPVEAHFGYIDSATHLHLDGLLVGFLASLVVSRRPRWLQLASSKLGIAVILALSASAVAIHRTDDDLFSYAAVPTVQALLFGALLMAGVGGGVRMPVGVDRLVRAVAITSYSAYLVHPLGIHAARAAVARTGELASVLYWPAVVTTVVGLTVISYLAVERSSIALRDRLVPRRRCSA